ncbi:MAG: XDD3 domain-containing surface protein [Jaaginema sp. PMC 1079.18]|nr:XDD3 domain-containing surface protein [Jaaginema sp. PMC 1080.18]MEC4851077.1 XDD3 domain-containing surface protein [Jaaginema sp. PMC 1079.18]MEC4865036.1 XDD3 domain-containing surface protein [Jaaginema sp. PMC 1078.18]
MFIPQRLSWFTGAALVLGTVAITAPNATAGTLHNGWNYGIDSFKDGTEYQSGRGLVVGSESAFEFYGMAMKETEDSVIFAINSNLGLSGYSASVRGGSIAWGDLFLNFSGSSTFDSATDLFAIRFAENNDSGVAELGLYSNVTTKSVAGVNSGHSSLSSYNNKVSNKSWNKDSGSWVYGDGDPSLADLASDTSYLNQSGRTHNVIKSGTKIGDVQLISDFSNLGLDFGYFGATGTNTFGFSVDKSLLPTGDFIAHILAECNNDGMALIGEISDAESVPEPAGLVGLGVFGLGLWGQRRRKHQKA